ncbi:hypothetical protein PHSY_005447 [Pseudozyma hubeiensis SY62]|uniref:Uncharacterized protein n=1 Tax=Pseudozyma hubeiensis (strain SY62) TaxID=1305764 RepID=R9P948_PSEHS|nr:hypothetical protein PHSY_005447 [Pseudozyma hubeiensis SY62]GAC97859.1 hypothetical protein PHSY_005447 [Pseudozyma hubeiensis SY62]
MGKLWKHSKRYREKDMLVHRQGYLRNPIEGNSSSSSSSSSSVECGRTELNLRRQIRTGPRWTMPCGVE